MSHGVHRGHLKTGKKDQRETFINRLMKMNLNINDEIYVIFKSENVKISYS